MRDFFFYSTKLSGLWLIHSLSCILIYNRISHLSSQFRLSQTEQFPSASDDTISEIRYLLLFSLRPLCTQTILFCVIYLLSCIKYILDITLNIAWSWQCAPTQCFDFKVLVDALTSKRHRKRVKGWGYNRTFPCPSKLFWASAWKCFFDWFR